MATATRAEVVTLTLTEVEAAFLRSFLAGVKPLTYGADIREALAKALAPF